MRHPALSELVRAGLLAAMAACLIASEAFGQIRRSIERPLAPVSQASLSEISGAAGDVTHEIEHGMRVVRFGELGDRPCMVILAAWTGQSSRDRAIIDAECSNRINTSQYWEVVVPEGARIVGMEACFNRRSGRLKGLRLYHDGGNFGGVVSELQPNCRGNRGRWGDRAECPESTRATGLRAHFRQEPRGQTNPIVGLQLICRPA